MTEICPKDRAPAFKGTPVNQTEDNLTIKINNDSNDYNTQNK